MSGDYQLWHNLEADRGVVVSSTPLNPCTSHRICPEDEKKAWRYERVYGGQLLSLEPFAVTGEMVEHGGQWWLEVWVDHRRTLHFPRVD